MCSTSNFIKKSFCFIGNAALIVLAFSLSISTAAATFSKSFSFSSLENLGVAAIFANKADEAPAIDGTVSNNEYKGENILTTSDGLSFATEDGFEITEDKREALGNINETVSVSYDDRYFYVAIRLFAPNGVLLPYDHDLYGNVFSVYISLSVAAGEDLLSRQAVLSNCYYFSSDSLSAVAMSGMRLQKQDNALKNVLQISSSMEAFQNKGFLDDMNVLWNGEKYCKEAAITLNGENSLLTFECRIPVGDVLLCLENDDRSEALSALKKEKAFVGSFLSRISVNSLADSSPLCVTSGISAKSVCPFSDTGETWNKVFVSHFMIQQTAAYSIDWLMTPLSFGGKLENEDDGAGNILSAVGDKPLNESVDDKEIAHIGAPPAVTTGTDVKDPVMNQDALEDESVFDDLPDPGETLPEHTEIIPIESEATKGESKNVFGSVFPFLAGVLMLVSVFVIAYVFFKNEKEEKNAKKTKKKT